MSATAKTKIDFSCESRVLTRWQHTQQHRRDRLTTTQFDCQLRVEATFLLAIEPLGNTSYWLRVKRVLSMAIETFGNRDKALVWLRRPCAPLDDEAPLRRLDTEEGARQVETLLGRIAHGIAA